MTYNKKLWEECANFHRHICPGLAIGFKAGEYIRKLWGVKASIDEEIVCVTENDACGVDAISYVLGCSLGKGNLIFRDRGKNAYSFFHRETSEAIRLVRKANTKGLSREESLEFYLKTDPEELFEIKKPHYELPPKAQFFSSSPCSKCEEITAEHRLRISDDKLYCLDCYDEYDRRW